MAAVRLPQRFLSRTASQLAGGFDRIFAGTALNPPRALRRRSSAESLDHGQRMRALALIEAFYNRPSFIEHPQEFFAQPHAIAPAIKRVQAYGREGESLDLRWASEFQPLWSTKAVRAHVDTLSVAQRKALGLADIVSVKQLTATLGIDKNGELADKYFKAKRNRFAHARWYRHHDGPRPCAVLLHGYMGGAYAIEERVWPVRKLFTSGFDVVMPVLPLHGARRSEARGFLPPAFPSSDPRFTIEGFRQVVFDQTALFDYLLAGRVRELGVMGMSLGGYSAALLATLDARLRFAVLFVPLAAIEDFAYTHGRLIGDLDERAAQRDALRMAQWPISPLARPSLVPPENVVVIAGEADRVTGLKHAERLAEHFVTPIEKFAGGHLLHFGKGAAFAPVWELLGRTYNETLQGRAVTATPSSS